MYSDPFRSLVPHLHLHLTQRASILSLSRRTPVVPGPRLVILILQRLMQLLTLTLLSLRPSLTTTPTKPKAMPSKIADATPTEPEVMPSKVSDASLRPPAMPKKCTLMPQKAIPGGSSNSAQDILDHVTAKYGSGMSPQYSNILALLTSEKGSQVTAPKCTDSGDQDGGDHSYIKLMRSDSDSDCKKAEPPNKKAKHDPSSRPEVTDTGSHGSKKKSKKTITSDSDSSESENLCGKLCSQPMREEIEKHQC